MTAKMRKGVKSGNRDKRPDVAAAVDSASSERERSLGSLRAAAHGLALLGLLRFAAESLRRYLTDGGITGITWKNPFAQIEFTILSEGVGSPGLESRIGEQLANIDALAEAQPRAREAVLSAMNRVTRQVVVRVARDGSVRTELPAELEAEIDELAAGDAKTCRDALAAGCALEPISFEGSRPAGDGKESFAIDLMFAVRPLNVDEERDCAFFPVMVGLRARDCDPSSWPEADRRAMLDDLVGKLHALDEEPLISLLAPAEEAPAVPDPDRTIPACPDSFRVAGGYVRPIYSLACRQGDLPLLLNFHVQQTPLNWAVGLALFSLTDEDRVRNGDWQEARINDLAERVFCLTGRDASIRGDHRTDILAEVVKLATTQNWYYSIDTVSVGRAWKQQASIGLQTAIPELQLVFWDKKTRSRAFAADPAFRQERVPLDLKGRRVQKPDGQDIWSLPESRWKVYAVRWRWVQAFNDDLLLKPDLVGSGKRKGLPKKKSTGKTIRKGYLIRVAVNIFEALQRLRSEGGRSVYACRLLIALAHDINQTRSPKREANRVFRMLAIPEDYDAKRHRRREDLVANAVRRLKQSDIGALEAGSDEYPQPDPNKSGPSNACYRFFLSQPFMPRTNIASKEEAEAIEAEYACEEEEPAQSPPGPTGEQEGVPGLEEPLPIPDGRTIRAAREAAGMSLRDFASQMKGPSFSTWAAYERGEATRFNKINSDTWARVRDFIARHGKGEK